MTDRLLTTFQAKFELDFLKVVMLAYVRVSEWVADIMTLVFKRVLACSACR
jgi:hypothetical protein